MTDFTLLLDHETIKEDTFNFLSLIIDAYAL